MKIEIELTPNFGVKVTMDPKMTYPIAYGLLRYAEEEVSCSQRLHLIDARNKAAEEPKAGEPGKERG